MQFVGLYCIIKLQCAVQKHKNMLCFFGGGNFGSIDVCTGFKLKVAVSRRRKDFATGVGVEVGGGRSHDG